MRVVILVPWRSDEGWRAKVWATCRSRWAALFPDWPIFEGASPPGPFNRSAAINHAARQAGAWDVALIIDADVMLRAENVRAAVDRAAKTGKVTWAHRRWRGLTMEATERLTRPDPVFAEGALGPGGVQRADFTADIDLIVEKTTRISWSCCIAIRRDAWDTIGGMDERFAGWGFEDGAFAAVVGGLVGWDRIEGDVLNLWHPRTPGAGKADRDGRNRHTPQALVNGRLGMRYMVALRRDYGLTDRMEPSSPETLLRDIGNLKHQDTDFAKHQTTAERKPWDDWWPTLEELRDTSIAYRVATRSIEEVTVIVTSGGEPDAWPARSGYLDRSLASLNEQVSGPIVQRVVYSDWGEELLTEVKAIADRHGFYVAGEGHHGHTTMRQRMWKYLARRGAGSFVFAAEDDFLYVKPVDLQPLIDTLNRDPQLAQVALLRDAFYASERERGGILGWPDGTFTAMGQNGTSRLEHRAFWTNNPSLFRRTLTSFPWPESQERSGRGKGSEVVFADMLRHDPAVRFAFWGEGEEYIQHIGEVRAGAGY